MEVDEKFLYLKYPFPTAFISQYFRSCISMKISQDLEKYYSQSDDKHFYSMRLLANMPGLYTLRARYTTLPKSGLPYNGVCTLIFQGS